MLVTLRTYGDKLSSDTASDILMLQGRLALNPGFFFLCSKAFSRIIVCVIFRASNHQLVDQKN